MLLPAILALSVGWSLVTDLRHRRIPNAVTLPALGAALLVRAACGWSGPEGLGSGLAGAALAFVPLLAVAWRGGLGMGDVKLAAVVGACLGFAATPAALLAIAIAGGVQALAALALFGGLRRWLGGRRSGLSVPYGVAIAAGAAWAALFQRPWP